MFAASVGAIVARPTAKLADERPPIVLETMVPKQFGDWRENDRRERSSLQAHKPEVCYPAQGFVLHKNDPGQLATAFGAVPVRRLFTTLGARQEPLTYWFTVGDTAVQSKLQKRLLDLRFGLTGVLPDGMLFRVSSIDPDQARAYQLQDHFVVQLLESVSPADRKRLSGLGGS